MIYIFGLLVAIQIITGQVLWKIGVEKTNFQFAKNYIFSDHLLKVFINPYIIGGVIFYSFATILFMALLSKYEYTSLQAVVVSSSLIFTFTAAAVLFGEAVSLLNLVGLGFLLIGVLLVTKF